MRARQSAVVKEKSAVLPKKPKSTGNYLLRAVAVTFHHGAGRRQNEALKEVCKGPGAFAPTPWQFRFLLGSFAGDARVRPATWPWFCPGRFLKARGESPRRGRLLSPVPDAASQFVSAEVFEGGPARCCAGRCFG